MTHPTDETDLGLCMKPRTGREVPARQLTAPANCKSWIADERGKDSAELRGPSACIRDEAVQAILFWGACVVLLDATRARGDEAQVPPYHS